MNIINFALPQITGTFGWIVEIIKWLTTITSSIALGVVLFTVILKLITLPFDFISKVSMKKNAIKMEEMRPELEKLQKQYADNKELYNQKMMALYKKNGYSMFGSCLPLILSLVIFIIAIGGFNDYSKYQNRQYFYDMAVAYNSVIYDGIEEDGDIIKKGVNSITVDGNKVLLTLGDEEETTISSPDVTYTVNKGTSNEQKFFTITSDNSYIIYKQFYNVIDGTPQVNGTVEYSVKESFSNEILYNGQTLTEYLQANEGKTSTDFVKEIAREKASETFRNNGASFLWLKNIWVSDSAFSHPVEDSWEDFKKNQEYKDSGMTADSYSELIAGLSYEVSAPNGFFILVILTAGMSLLLQVITSKSQKAQMELQTVDGQGAQTQKIMNIMMPLMMGVFSFMYTAAFSIYIIVSNAISIISTVSINKIVEAKYGNKSNNGKNEIVRGRVYEPKQEEKPVTKKKKEPEIVKNDFLSGYADKKRK